MVKRLVVPALATVAALVLLWLVMQVETAPSQADRPEAPAPAARDISINTGGDNQSALDPRAQVVEQSAATSFQHVTEHGTLIQFSYQSLELLPEGVSDVQQPLTRIHLKQNRSVLQIQSQRGRLIAPERHPRSGTLEGDVVVSFFEAPGQETVNLQPDSPHLQMRMQMERARFDLELGQLDSDGPVLVSGPRFDFQGHGLTMTYNELRRRIDRLEIARGQQLVLKPKPQAGEPAAAATAGDADKDKPGKAREPKPPQFYRATFHRDVRIVHDDATIDAQTLSLVFNGQGNSLREMDRGAARRAPDSPLPLPAQPLATHLVSLIPASTAELMNDEPGKKAQGPVTITWTGKLVLEPLEQRPAELRSDDDALVELTGRPLLITTRRQEVLQAARLQYARVDDVVSILGDETYRLQLQSPELGRMRGTRLVARRDDATVTVYGPGQLRAHDQPTLLQPASMQANSRNLPPGSSITWDDRLELVLLRGSDEQPVKGLKAADFYGNVQVDHPMLEMRGDHLALGLGGDEQRPELRHIEVDGHVQALATLQNEPDPLVIESEHLMLEFEPDAEGKPQPARLVCTQARGTLNKQRLSAGELEALFVIANPVVRVPQRLPEVWQPQPVPDPLSLLLNPQDSEGSALRRLVLDKPAKKSRRAQPPISRLVAQKDVQIELTDPQARILGHRLVADAGSDQVEIFGQDAEHRARVIFDSGELLGDHLVLHNTAQTVHVLGPGLFDVKLGSLDTAADKPRGDLRVSWEKAMHFDQRNGLAQFLGNVVALAQETKSRSRLSAEDVRLDLINVKLRDRQADAQQPGNPLARLRMLVAHGSDVVFESQSTIMTPAGMPEHRLRLQGPLLSFDNVLERLQVIGAGRMLFEDYRQRPAKPQNSSQADNPLTQFTGQGVTLFTWQSQLTLDAAHNDMTLDQGVQMLHAPQDGKDKVQLDCRRFVADLEQDDKGLAGWFSGSGRQPRLSAALADGAVRVRSGSRAVATDRLTYTGSDQVIVLRADEGRFTTVQDPAQPLAPTARLVRWDLRSGRIDIEKPGAIAAPTN